MSIKVNRKREGKWYLFGYTLFSLLALEFVGINRHNLIWLHKRIYMWYKQLKKKRAEYTRRNENTISENEYYNV